MKLVYVANQRLPTEKAYGIQIAAMCRAFARTGAEVELFVPTRKNRLPGDIAAYYGTGDDFRVTRVWAPDFQLPGGLDRVAFWLKQFVSAKLLAWRAVRSGPDVIYTRDEAVAAFSRLFLGRRVILELHSYSRARLPIYLFLRLLHVRLICITQGLKDRLAASGIPRDRILVAPDGVDLEPYEVPLSQADARRSLHVPPEIPVIGYVGHLRTRGDDKGIGVLLDAFRLLRLKFPGVLLLIVGGNEGDVAHYRALALKLGLGPDAVRFDGHRPHSRVPRYLRAMSVLTMPYPATEHYRHFMSPLKLFEYMASGVPIVASDLPSLREVISWSNAALVPPGNAQALADVIGAVLNEPDAARSRAIRSRTDVRQYSWLARAQQILSSVR